MRKLLFAVILMPPMMCLADQTAYSDYCRTADIANTISNIYCFGGQQLFNTNPSPIPNTLPVSGAFSRLTLKLAWRAYTDGQLHSTGLGAAFFNKQSAPIYCYLPSATFVADGQWHDVDFDISQAVSGNNLTHNSDCDVNFGTDKLLSITLNSGNIVGAWTDTNIYTDGVSEEQNSYSSPNHSLWFTVGVNPKPIVIVVPGFGASTLTDTNQTPAFDQWLSCSSILNMHNGYLAPMQYDNNGNPLLSLAPTTILMQNDSVTDAVKLPSQSVMQCSNDELVAVACASSWGGCALLNSGLPRALIQRAILLAAGGDMLQFNTLLASLISQGYNPDAWKYDFRRDISALADDLYQEIQTVSLANPGRPIAIVTHSQGTLVTAAMIQKYRGVYDSGLVSNVISMSPPFAGAIDTYLYAQGWRSFLPFLSAPSTKTLGQYWRSVYQLLPQWDFVTRLNPPFPTKYNIFKGQGDPQNFPPLPLAQLVPDLGDPASLWSLLDSLGPLQRWYAIIGQGQATANQIVERLNDGNYKPCLTIDEEDGDGTVPLRSAQAGSIVPPSNQIYVQEVHKNLPQNSAVIGGILSILGGTSPFVVTGLSNAPAPFTRTDTIVLNSCSPVNLTVTDSSGNVISAQLSQVPSATFANIGSATQVDIPWNGTFQVEITGTGTGTFDLLVNGLGGEHSPLSYFYKAVPVQAGSQGNVIVGGTTVPTLQYNYAGKSIIDSIPANANPPTIVCTGCYFITNNLRASFAFNIGYPGGVSAFTYNYRSATQTIQFVSTTTAEISVVGSTATFSGQGTLNGHAGYSFAVTANDLGAAGSGLDTVSITITGPNGYSYVVNASVIGGDVVVHQ